MNDLIWTAAGVATALSSGAPVAAYMTYVEEGKRPAGDYNLWLVYLLFPLAWLISWSKVATMRKQQLETREATARARALGVPSMYEHTRAENIAIRKSWERWYRYQGEVRALSDDTNKIPHPELEPPKPPLPDMRGSIPAHNNDKYYPCTQSHPHNFPFGTKVCYLRAHRFPRPNLSRTIQLLTAAQTRSNMNYVHSLEAASPPSTALTPREYELLGHKDTDDLIERLDAVLDPPKPKPAPKYDPSPCCELAKEVRFHDRDGAQYMRCPNHGDPKLLPHAHVEGQKFWSYELNQMYHHAAGAPHLHDTRTYESKDFMGFRVQRFSSCGCIDLEGARKRPAAGFINYDKAVSDYTARPRVNTALGYKIVSNVPSSITAGSITTDKIYAGTIYNERYDECRCEDTFTCQADDGSEVTYCANCSVVTKKSIIVRDPDTNEYLGTYVQTNDLDDSLDW